MRLPCPCNHRNAFLQPGATKKKARASYDYIELVFGNQQDGIDCSALHDSKYTFDIGYFGRQWLGRRSPEEEGMELALVQHDYGNVEEDAKLTRKQVELGKVRDVISPSLSLLCDGGTTNDFVSLIADTMAQCTPIHPDSGILPPSGSVQGRVRQSLSCQHLTVRWR